MDYLNIFTGVWRIVFYLTVNRCIPPAVRQFPRPFFSQESRSRGAISIYFALAIYAFVGLAIVCDEFFVPSLDIMCESKCG